MTGLSAWVTHVESLFCISPVSLLHIGVWVCSSGLAPYFLIPFYLGLMGFLGYGLPLLTPRKSQANTDILAIYPEPCSVPAVPQLPAATLGLPRPLLGFPVAGLSPPG